MVNNTVVTDLDEVIAELRGLVFPCDPDRGDGLPVVTENRLRGLALVVLLSALEVQNAWDSLGI